MCADHNTAEATARLLLCCAQHRFDAEARACAAQLLRRGVDWDTLLMSARRHNLLSLLYYRLRELDGALVPSPVMARLRSAYYTNLLRNERLQGELRRVVKALHRNGVTPIVLKGGVLARTVYANLALRPMHDLDLLVRPTQMGRVDATLKGLGFRLSSALPAHLLPFQQRFGGGVTWLRSSEEGTTALDVQHHLVGVDWYWNATHVELETLWEAARPLPLNGASALQLSPEDMLIHLCLHPAVQHGYACSLIHCVDVDWLVGKGELRWPLLVERAKGFGVGVPVYWELSLVRRLLRTPVPIEVLEGLKPTGLRMHVLRKLAPQDEETLLRGASRRVSGVHQLLLQAVLVDDVRGMARMARDILFPSSDWLAMRYSLKSRGQLRLYRLIHPLKVTRAFLRGLRRPLVESGLE